MKKINIVLFIILLLGLFLFSLRLFSPREIDDIHPLRPCEQEYIQKADILWVIPEYKNYSIANNKTWCNEILKLNKTLGMHGITHEYHEFELKNISQNELNKAIKEFEECFGYKPQMFKPPYLHLNKKNRKLLKENNLKIKYRFNQAIHKVYHCEDSGTLPNRFHDIF